MNVILLDIAVVSKDYQGCLLKPSRASVWSLRRDQTEFTCPAVPSRLLVAFQSLRYLEQRQRMVLAGRRARWCLLCLPHSTGEWATCLRLLGDSVHSILLGLALLGFMLFFPF